MRVVQNSNNILRVLKLVKQNRGISRIDISKKLSLDKSTVTVVVKRLMDLGFVEETTETLSEYQGGRKPVGLRICEDRGLILGLEIQTDYYSAVLIDLTGKVYKRLRGEAFEADSFLEYFLKIYRQVFPEIDRMDIPLLGIGIAAAGLINPHEGIIYDSNPLGIHSPENFYEEVRPFIQVPIFIENDANCGCWAELANQDTSRPQDFLYVLGEFRRAQVQGDNTYLLAFGLGIVIGERVHYGRNFAAGEYQSPYWNSENHSQFSVSDEKLRGVQSDREIIDLVKEDVCKDLAFLVNIFNFSCVTFGGGVAKYVEELKPLLNREVAYNWSYSEKESLEIRSNPEEEVIALGAASMLLEHLFILVENASENPWQQKVGIELFNSFADLMGRKN
ncbi:MAG: ROK family transcriptional regulator [Spirochaetales bacterium]|nr:ROK family transcriptional regulator [Spirochaetales bacterium]